MSRAANKTTPVSYLHLTTMRASTLLLVFLSALDLCAQRQWEVNDSTSYSIGGDTVLIASRKKLYRQVSEGTVLLRDFTVLEDENYYIRDVDHWTSRDWYVIVGSRYIGHPTSLWRTTDAGATWSVDGSFLPATEEGSLNQMAITPDGIAYLFNGYYESEVLRSFDHGVTWSRWFQSLIAHYYGIIPCGNTAFIYGMVGDAFRPALWQVPDTLWEEEDIWFWSGCHNVIPECQYPPFGVLDYPEVVAHFEEVATELCMSVHVDGTERTPLALSLVMEPGEEWIRLTGIDPQKQVLMVDAIGRPVRAQREDDRINVGQLAAGVYCLLAHHSGTIGWARFMKH